MRDIRLKGKPLVREGGPEERCVIRGRGGGCEGGELVRVVDRVWVVVGGGGGGGGGVINVIVVGVDVWVVIV